LRKCIRPGQYGEGGTPDPVVSGKSTPFGKFKGGNARERKRKRDGEGWIQREGERKIERQRGRRWGRERKERELLENQVCWANLRDVE